MDDGDDYLAEEMSDEIITEDEPVMEVLDVATQTEEKHSNRRYIICDIPKKFGEIFLLIRLWEHQTTHKLHLRLVEKVMKFHIT